MVVDQNHNVLDQIVYNAYGQIVLQTNTANAPMYLFQGGYLDTDTGLYRFGARYYCPAAGTWISEDPRGFNAGDANLHFPGFGLPGRWLILQLPKYQGVMEFQKTLAIVFVFQLSVLPLLM